MDGKYFENINNEIKNYNSFYFDGKEQKALISQETIDLLFNIDNLEDITLKNLELKFISKSIEKLTKLESLDLSDNELTELPEALGKLDKLEFLCLDNNHLSDLPQSIQHLKSLMSISLKNNEFKMLPEVIQYCLTLDYLNLEENNLLNLPAFIAQMPNLKTITVSKNPNFQTKGEGDSFGKLELAKLLMKQKEAILYKEKHNEFYKIFYVQILRKKDGKIVRRLDLILVLSHLQKLLRIILNLKKVVYIRHKVKKHMRVNS